MRGPHGRARRANGMWAKAFQGHRVPFSECPHETELFMPSWYRWGNWGLGSYVSCPGSHGSRVFRAKIWTQAVFTEINQRDSWDLTLRYFGASSWWCMDATLKFSAFHSGVRWKHCFWESDLVKALFGEGLSPWHQHRRWSSRRQNVSGEGSSIFLPGQQPQRPAHHIYLGMQLSVARIPRWG